ncbi:MAG TPA: hypothetical protein VFN43_06125, partial [Humibacillus sp.]|nr:hypothetical protein [Humibacillus sp.]
MKRILAGIAAVAVAGLVAATPATAAQSTVKRETFRGFSVDANWAVSTSSSYDETYVAASQSNQGSTLVLTAVHGNLDAGGNFTGGRVTSAEVGSGFTLTFDAVRLATAHVRATGVPARTCD